MANTKEVRKQIASIKSTRKITSALEMVAASKIKKTGANVAEADLTLRRLKTLLDTLLILLLNTTILFIKTER